MKPDRVSWTLNELGDRVADALRVGYAGVPSGRVRDVPDARTIRYYTTLGLLDRPALRGRTALYGPRHLRQLVAIKRLQAQGLSLAEIQRRLIGQPDATLERLARPQQDEAPTRPDASPEPDRARSFWRSAPGEGPAPAPGPIPEHIRLAEGVALTIDARRPLGDEELRLVRMATAPLIELLRLHDLIGPEGPRGGPR
jgi:DNA-binding transcriptional MerR regulator